MIWTLLALVCLVALGGFIAYYGDLQGRRWGKKRVSWFGLRPKHTAILITSLTGGFISLLSIVTLLAINQPLREALLRGEQAIRENKVLISRGIQERMESAENLREMQDRIKGAQAALARFRVDYRQLEAKTAAKQRRVNELAKREQALMQEQERLQSQLASVEDDLARQKQALAQADRQYRRLQVAKRKLDEWTNNAKVINNEIGRQNTQLSRRNYELARQSKDLGEQNAQLTTGNQNLLRARDDLIRRNDALDESNRILLAGIADQEKKKQELVGGIEKLQAEIARLDRDYQFVVGDIAKSYLALRQGRFSLRAGAELARRTVEPHQRPEAIRRVLGELLDEADAVALVHRAARGANRRAVRIIGKRTLTTAGEQFSSEASRLDALVDSLTGLDRPVVLVVNAINNSVEGEQVSIELTPSPVRTLFDKDEPLASCRINASQPTEKVFDSIVSFLNRDVRDAALKAGTIPRTDPDTGQMQVGNISTIDLVKLTERVRRMGGQVVLTAVAEEKTTSADPLRLDFRLTRPTRL